MNRPECECPNCGALIDTLETEKYELVKCHNCEMEFEFIGDGLVNPDSEE